MRRYLNLEKTSILVKCFYWNLKMAEKRRLTKLEFVSRLGADYRNILLAAKQNVDVEMFVKMLDWATPEADGTSIDLDDFRVSGALQTMEASGILSPGKASAVIDTPVPDPSTVSPEGFATVYQEGTNFSACLAHETPPATFDASWQVAAIYYTLIAQGAQLRVTEGQLEIVKKVS